MPNENKLEYIKKSIEEFKMEYVLLSDQQKEQVINELLDEGISDCEKPEHRQLLEKYDQEHGNKSTIVLISIGALLLAIILLFTFIR